MINRGNDKPGNTDQGYGIMNDKSRVRNSLLNFTSSIGGQLLTILMQFVIRTVFIHTLGKEYLGIGGLFKNILSMLSLAEMGVGSAIVFKLYEPIASNDMDRISILMKFYKKVYRWIGFAIAVIGLALIPFLPKLINDYDKLESLNLNVALIFILYLLDSVSSYLFFAYKSALVKADQKEYSINLIGYIFTILSGVAQIICLLIFRSFILYVAILILKTVLQNLVVARMADRKYPCLKSPGTETIQKKEARGIFKDCGALFIYKINNVVVKSTDNIVLSAFIGLDAVALYSNYYIFYTTIVSLFNKVYNSVGHSIGNLHATHDIKKEYKVFESTMLIAAILGGTVFTGLFVVADEFVGMWLGNDWELQQPFSFLLGMELFTSSFKYAMAKYRTAYGLFTQGWIRPLFAMIINLGVSLALVQPLGIVGVLIGTLVSDWTTFVWYDPLIVHRIGFENAYPVSRYFLKFAKYTLVCLALGCLEFLLCANVFTGHGWFSVIVHSAICGIITPTVLILTSLHTEEGKYVLNILKKITRKVKKRKK